MKYECTKVKVLTEQEKKEAKERLINELANQGQTAGIAIIKNL